ncbi:peptidase domain-containing ABC transporter [Sphingomonas sp. CJ20]
MTQLLNFRGARKTPYIAQTEASECALACLAMVAGHHGLRTDLVSLRQRFGFSLKGATLKQVIEVAETIGFNARPLRGEIEDLAHLSLPAILHWNLNHFVVLVEVARGFGGTRYCIHDPARGVRHLTREEVSQSFTGVALDLLKSETFRPRVEQVKLGITQLWSSMSGFWQTMRQVFLLTLVLQFASLASPFLLQTSIDTVFPSFDRDLLFMLAVGFGGLAIINMLASWMRALILVTLNNSLSYQVVINLFRHLVRLPLPWFEKRHVGDVISRFGSTQPITQLLSQGMIAAFIDGAMVLITLAMMFVYSGILAGITVTALAIYGAIRVIFIHSLRFHNIDAITSSARESSTFIETVRGISAIKAFGQEGNRQRIWQKAKADATNSQIRLGRLNAGFDAIAQFVIAVERVLFVYVAVSLALDARLSIGMLFAFQAYKQQFLDASMRLVDQAINFNIIKVHLSRIADIALSAPEEGVDASASDRPDFSQTIELRQIVYRYGVGEPDVLKGISFTIEPGEMIALIGPSGGGKTTLMKVMMGLFDPVYGQVLIGGRPVTSFGKRALRQSIGSIAQDDVLYAGTLAENIAFFDPEIDMLRIEEVARLAAIHDEIDRLPLRYDTLIGDMGSVLSGGQKQRVLLARALYSRPKLLFMDEGTAHLDPVNEAKVLGALSALKITRVVIAHRSQSVLAADRVITIVDGNLLESVTRTSPPDRLPHPSLA